MRPIATPADAAVEWFAFRSTSRPDDLLAAVRTDLLPRLSEAERDKVQTAEAELQAAGRRLVDAINTRCQLIGAGVQVEAEFLDQLLAEHHAALAQFFGAIANASDDDGLRRKTIMFARTPDEYVSTWCALIRAREAGARREHAEALASRMRGDVGKAAARRDPRDG